MKRMLARLNALARKYASFQASILLNAAVIALLCLYTFRERADDRTLAVSFGTSLLDEPGLDGGGDLGFPDIQQPRGHQVSSQPASALLPPDSTTLFANTPDLASLPSVLSPSAGLAGAGEGSGSSGGGGGGGGRIGGLTVQARRLGVILDISGSMEDDAARVADIIQDQFQNALCARVVGCELMVATPPPPTADLPFDFGRPMQKAWQTESAWPAPRTKKKKDWPWPENQPKAQAAAPQVVHGETSETIHAMSLLAKHGVDAIYWFCDLQDHQTLEGLREIEKILRTHHIRFYVQSQELEPSPLLKTIVTQSGGEYSVRRSD